MRSRLLPLFAIGAAWGVASQWLDLGVPMVVGAVAFGALYAVADALVRRHRA